MHLCTVHAGLRSDVFSCKLPPFLSVNVMHASTPGIITPTGTKFHQQFPNEINTMTKY